MTTLASPEAPPPAPQQKRAGASTRPPSAGIAASFGTIAYLVSIAIAFVQSPYLIHQLGDARYGTWNLIGQLTGYYGLLDLGVRGAVGHYVASMLARGEEEKLAQLTSSAFWLLMGVAVLALLGGAGLVWFFPKLFDTSGIQLAELRPTLVLAVLAVACTLPLDVFAAIVTGARRQELMHGVDVVVRIASVLAIFVALSNGGGLITLGVIQLSGKMLTWVMAAYFVRRLVPATRFSPRLFRRDRARDVVSYGSRNFVINIATLVANRFDTVLIGAVLGVRSVTFYALGQLIVTYTSSANSIVTRAYTAHFAHHHSRNDEESLRDAYFAGSRLSSTVALLIAAYALAFGSSFLRLWVGPEYVTGAWNGRSDVVMAVLFAASLPRMLQSISWQLLFGTRRQHYLMVLLLRESLVNLALSVVLVRWIGLVGVAVGTLIPRLVTNLWFLPRYVLPIIGVPFGEYVRRGFGRPLVVGSIVLAVSAPLAWLLPPTGWPMFALEAAGCSLLGAVLVVAIVMDRTERGAIRARVARLLRRR